MAVGPATAGRLLGDAGLRVEGALDQLGGFLDTSDLLRGQPFQQPGESGNAPLAALFPKRSTEELGVTARSLFSAVHGMVLLGLEQKLIAVPIEALRREIAAIVKAMVEGLAR